MLYLIMLVGMMGVGCATASLQQKQDEFSKDLQELRRSHALTAQRLRELDRLNQTSFLIQDSIERLSLEVERLERTLVEIQTQIKIVQTALFDVHPAKPPYIDKSVENNDTEAGLPGSPEQARPIKVSRSTAQTAKGGEAVVAGNSKRMVLQEDERTIYQAAYEAMQAGRTDEAVAGFSRLIERFSSSDLADNAHYWLGEVYLGLGDQGSATKHFLEIINNYPRGNKVPDALYKLGVLAQEQGDCSTAISWYRKVQEQYPWATVTEKVTLKLNECNAKP